MDLGVGPAKRDSANLNPNLDPVDKFLSYEKTNKKGFLFSEESLFYKSCA
jgi:hypothetical protein